MFTVPGGIDKIIMTRPTMLTPQTVNKRPRVERRLTAMAEALGRSADYRVLRRLIPRALSTLSADVGTKTAKGNLLMVAFAVGSVRKPGLPPLTLDGRIRDVEQGLVVQLAERLMNRI